MGDEQVMQGFMGSTVNSTIKFSRTILSTRQDKAGIVNVVHTYGVHSWELFIGIKDSGS